MKIAIQMDRTLNNNIFQARRGENVLLSGGQQWGFWLKKENAGYISLLLVVSGWWDITANSTTRTKTAHCWLN